MIIVTGATGQLGSRIVDRLLDRLPADRIGVSVRDTTKAAALADRGVQVRHGDYADPSTLATAFAGADQVLLVSSNSAGAEAVAQHRAAADAARAAGVRRILYTSHQAAASDSLFAPMPDHFHTEQYLAAQGGAFTSLRNGFYASTVGVLLGRALQTGVLAAPADGPVSWTGHDDLAEAAAVVLADEGRLDGLTPPLTAPATHDLAAVAAELSGLTGRTITREVVGDDEWTAGLIANGVPEFRARLFLGLFLASRRGEFDVTDPTLEKLLERPATPLRSFLAGVVEGD